MSTVPDTVQRVAVVTGSNRGLGHAVARGLARHGMHVVVTARTEEAAVRAADQLGRQGLSVSGHQLDVTDPASVARLMADTAYHHGRLDVLVNNAAVAIDRGQAASTADMEKVSATLDANILGAWRCCTAAIPEMRMAVLVSCDRTCSRVLNAPVRLSAHTCSWETTAPQDRWRPSCPCIRRSTRRRGNGGCAVTSHRHRPGP